MHTHCVNHAASVYQQTFTCGKRWAPKQATRTLVRIGGLPHPWQYAQVGCFTVNGTKSHTTPDFKNFITMGKPITINVHGKINIISGPINFTGASIASFSARIKRSLRRCSA